MFECLYCKNIKNIMFEYLFIVNNVNTSSQTIEYWIAYHHFRAM